MALRVFSRMPIHAASNDGAPSWVWRERRPLSSFLKLLAFVVVSTPFGPGVLALGSATFEVRCRRDGVMTCTLSEGYLFGLAPLEHTLTDVQASTLVEVGDEGATVVQLSGPMGAIRSSAFSSSLDRSKQRALVKAVSARLDGPAFVERRSMVALPFLLFGALFSLLWVLATWGLVTTPFAWLWPTRLRVEGDTLWVRSVRAWPLEKGLSRSAVREVQLTRNPGGPFGAFVAKPRENVPAPPLHVVLVLADGEVRLLNRDQTPDVELQTFAQQLAQALGCRCRLPDR